MVISDYITPVMYVDPSGDLFITFLIVSMSIGALIGSSIAGYSAYKSGETGWDLVANIFGGALLGAATGAALALGGAAGLTSVGVSLTGYSLSTIAALNISVGITSLASMANYSLKCIDSNSYSWSTKGLLFSGLQGAVQGLTTFGIAYFGGRHGMFNKMADFSSSNIFWIDVMGAESMKSSINALAYTSNIVIGETLSRAIMVSSPAAIIRYLIDLIINEE